MEVFTPTFYSQLLKVSYFVASIPASLVVITAYLSTKQMGGTLGEGLKKIAGGSIIHTIIVITYLFLERGARGLLDAHAIQLFFIIGGIFGSLLLIWGYTQIYHIAKRLRLFTV